MVDGGSPPDESRDARTTSSPRAPGRGTDAQPLLAARLLILVQVVAWFGAAIPPQLTLRALILPWIATAAAAGLAALPVSAPLRRPATIVVGVSALGASTATWAVISEAPETTALGAATLVLLTVIHVVASVGLRTDPRPAIVQVADRPFRRTPGNPWPFALQLALLTDAGLVIGLAFTGVATLGGGFLSAGAAVVGWIVFVGGLGAAALEVGLAGPAMLAATVRVSPTHDDGAPPARSPAHMPDSSAKMPG